MRFRFALVGLLLLVACGDDGGRGSNDDDDGSGGGGGTGGSPNTPVCGNGVVEEAEACDDAGVSAACNADCTVAACGDGIGNAAAGEMCDDGNGSATDLCDACMPVPFVIDSGAWTGLWPDVAVAQDEGAEVFLVAYKESAGTNANDVVVQKYDVGAQPLGGPLLLDPNGGAGPLSIAASPQGGALVAWMPGSAYTTRWRVLDAGLYPIPGVSEWSGFREPHVAAAQGGGYCVAAFDKDAPIPVHCLDAEGNTTGQSAFAPTWGAEYLEGSELVPVGDGYLFAYVPDKTTHDLVAFPVDANGAQGNGFAVTDWTNTYWSWVPGWGATAGEPGFVALAGQRVAPNAQEWILHYRVYTAPGEPATELLPVSDEPMQVDGVAVRHASGRFAIFWLGDITRDPETNAIASCAVKARTYDADGTPTIEPVTLHDPAGQTCSHGVRGAVDAAGNVLLTWIDLTIDAPSADKRGLLLPALLAP
jgi:hypothetical protein